MFPTLLVISVLVVLSLVVACDEGTQSGGMPVGAMVTPNSKDAFSTRVAATRQAMRTEVALSGRPTRIPGPPPPYLGPTSTPQLGIFPGYLDNQKNPANPRITSVWVGWVNNRIVRIEAGSEGTQGDPTQGLIKIFDPSQCCQQVYRTPDQPGALFMQSGDGVRFALTSEDGYSTYVFDLPSRQWVLAPDPASNSLVRPTLTSAALYDHRLASKDGSLAGTAMRIYSRWGRGFVDLYHDDPPPMSVEAGSEGLTGDVQQGKLRVTVWRQGAQDYKTPVKCGPIRIVEKNGDLFTVSSLNRQYTFVFDLNARQWISGTPVPSASPLPTQAP
jgi:hypothetical protein